MNRLLAAAIRSRSHGDRMILACLSCAQAMAPDWPVLTFWPFLKLSFASSIARASDCRNRRRLPSVHSVSSNNRGLHDCAGVNFDKCKL